MNAYSIKIECEEDGFHLIIDGDSPFPEYQASIIDYRIQDIDLDAFYDQVKARIGSYLRDRNMAHAGFKRAVETGGVAGAVAFVCSPEDVDESAGAYELSDPKHPEFHSIHADIWDARADK